MSKVAELAYDIEQLYIDGVSARRIAVILECPIEVVHDALTEMGVADSPQEESNPMDDFNYVGSPHHY